MRHPIGALMIVAGLLTLPQPTFARSSCGAGGGLYDTGGAPDRSAVVNDPLLSKQWGLKQINGPQAWKRGASGEGAVIAVVDTGIDLSHPDLRANLVEGADLAIEGEERDCPGPQDQDGHGTHVAGIAAGIGGNGVGTVGIAPEAKLMPVRALRGNEGALELNEATRRVAQGIRYAANNGADVINLSLSTFYITDNPLSGVSQAIEFAWNKGAVIVAAAGNDEDPLCKYPAADPRVICVAATNREGEIAPYSNRPVKPTDDTVVLAPGGDYFGDRNFCNERVAVLSTYLARGGFDHLDCGLKGYTTLWGTSMATPHVAGVAALLSGLGLDNQQIVECLLKTASNNGTYDSSTGYGVVNAGKAVTRCA